MIELCWRVALIGSFALLTGAGFLAADWLGGETYRWLKRVWIGDSPLRALGVAFVAAVCSSLVIGWVLSAVCR